MFTGLAWHYTRNLWNLIRFGFRNDELLDQLQSEALSSNCWLDNRRISTIVRKLHEPLGRMFRHFLWGGVKIWVNESQIAALDPLFLHRSTALTGAVPFGEPLTFEVRVPGNQDKTSLIKVRFAELPVAKWHDLPVEDKRKFRIVDGAGLSILRAGPEVDYGWWFFGAKRRENYDSWWRGELSFEPELDELFAITHSKQGINPTQGLREVLTPDLEAAARQMNARVQAAFAKVKQAEPKPPDPQPVAAPSPSKRSGATEKQPEPKPSVNGKTAPAREQIGKAEPAAAEFMVKVEQLKGEEFFEARQAGGRWSIVLNSDHDFYRHVYAPLHGAVGEVMRRQLVKLLVAFAKAEAIKRTAGRSDPATLRASWSNQLAAILEGHT